MEAGLVPLASHQRPGILILVEDVPQDHIHAGGHTFVIIAVVAVIDGDIADAKEEKDALQIAAHLRIVPVASGKSFVTITLMAPVRSSFMSAWNCGRLVLVPVYPSSFTL